MDAKNRYYKMCCDPLKIHKKYINKNTRPVPKDLLENADRCFDLRVDNYICVNCIKKLRKKESSTDSSEDSSAVVSVQSNFSEENEYSTIEKIQDILDASGISPIKTGKYLHILVFYLMPI